MLQCEGSAEHGRAIERVGMSPICEASQTRKHVPKIKHKRLRNVPGISGIMYGKESIRNRCSFI